MFPYVDPNSEKYRNDPDRVWYGGQWITLEAREKMRSQTRSYNASDRGKAVKAKYQNSDRGKAVKARWDASDNGRAARYRSNLVHAFTPGPCCRRDCDKPKQEFSTGRYSTYCTLHNAQQQTFYHLKKQMKRRMERADSLA
jgi:hypothetical protein